MKFPIWIEGFQATGESGKAQQIGTIEAKSFQEACDKLGRTPTWREHYDPKARAMWGCRMFDNEADARRSFG